jgi:hypothetical protein
VAFERADPSSATAVAAAAAAADALATEVSTSNKLCSEELQALGDGYEFEATVSAISPATALTCTSPHDASATPAASTSPHIESPALSSLPPSALTPADCIQLWMTDSDALQGVYLCLCVHAIYIICLCAVCSWSPAPTSRRRRTNPLSAIGVTCPEDLFELNTSNADSSQHETHAAAHETHAAAHETHAAALETHAAALETHAAVHETHAAAHETHAAALETHAAALETHAAAADGNGIISSAGRVHSHDEDEVRFKQMVGTPSGSGNVVFKGKVIEADREETSAAPIARVTRSSPAIATQLSFVNFSTDSLYDVASDIPSSLPCETAVPPPAPPRHLIIAKCKDLRRTIRYFPAFSAALAWLHRLQPKS